MSTDPFERAAARESEERRRKRRDVMKVGMRVHAVVYVAVNVLLVATWALTADGTGLPWFIWPLLGWGIGLAAHLAAGWRLLRKPDAPGQG